MSDDRAYEAIVQYDIAETSSEEAYGKVYGVVQDCVMTVHEETLQFLKDRLIEIERERSLIEIEISKLEFRLDEKAKEERDGLFLARCEMNGQPLTGFLSSMWLAGFILIVLIIGSSFSYEDEVAETKHYREMVCDGHWPDFKETEPEC